MMVHFFPGIDATMGYGICNEDTFLQGNETTMGDCHFDAIMGDGI